jgi:RNA polymerase sigma-70 factor (ECF subfamily)
MPKEVNRMDMGADSDFDEICRSTWKEIYRFIYYRVQNREEAEDITQETYARAFYYLKNNGTLVLDYGSYLRAIAMNVIRDQWRKNKKKGQSVNLEEIDPVILSAGDFTGEVEDRTVIEKAIRMLPKDQQTVIQLRILEGLSSQETARRMNRKEGTIRVLQYRAIKALSKQLKDK